MLFRVLCKIISLPAGETGLVEEKTLVNSSKSDFMGTEVARQTFQSFNRINKLVMNHNIMSCTVEHLSKLEIVVYKN